MINAFFELGLPYILRFIDDWRAGRATLKDAIARGTATEDEKPVPRTEEEVERRFLEKIEFELSLPEYTTFSEYKHVLFLISCLLENGLEVKRESETCNAPRLRRTRLTPP